MLQDLFFSFSFLVRSTWCQGPFLQLMSFHFSLHLCRCKRRGRGLRHKAFFSCTTSTLRRRLQECVRVCTLHSDLFCDLWRC
jgi:hypothetical protein